MSVEKLEEAQRYWQQSAQTLQGSDVDAQHRLWKQQKDQTHAAIWIQEVPGPQYQRTRSPHDEQQVRAEGFCYFYSVNLLGGLLRVNPFVLIWWFFIVEYVTNIRSACLCDHTCWIVRIHPRCWIQRDIMAEEIPILPLALAIASRWKIICYKWLVLVFESLWSITRSCTRV